MEQNAVVREIFSWFRVSDARLRIPVYLTWSFLVCLIMDSMFTRHNLFTAVPTAISMGFTLGLYVYVLGAVGGPLHWVLKQVGKIPYSGLLLNPLFTLPWYVFGWPSEKLYSTFFSKFTCLETGLEYSLQGEYEKAISELNNAKVSKNDTGALNALHSALGDSYGGLDRFDEAIDAYEKAVQYDPNDGSSRMGLGFCLLKNGRYNEALSILRDIVKSDPEKSNAYLGIARCYIETNMYQDAMVNLNQALALEPQNAVAHKMMAETLAGLGNNNEAVKEARLSLTLNPDPEIAAEAQELINTILHSSGTITPASPKPTVKKITEDKAQENIGSKGGLFAPQKDKWTTVADKIPVPREEEVILTQEEQLISPAPEESFSDKALTANSDNSEERFVKLKEIIGTITKFYWSDGLEYTGEVTPSAIVKMKHFSHNKSINYLVITENVSAENFPWDTSGHAAGVITAELDNKLELVNYDSKTKTLGNLTGCLCKGGTVKGIIEEPIDDAAVWSILYAKPLDTIKPLNVERINALTCINSGCRKELPLDSLFCGYCGTKLVQQ